MYVLKAKKTLTQQNEYNKRKEKNMPD